MEPIKMNEKIEQCCEARYRGWSATLKTTREYKR
jgi:hypothetical protein